MADRTTATQLEVLLSTGPAQARTTATQAEVLLTTGPSQARATSVVLEALVSIAGSIGGPAPGWVSVIG
jgi:hypothetical protein